MARIAYALSGQGRGHASRVLAMADALTARDHEIRFFCGGTAFEILSNRVANVSKIPALKQVVQGNRLCIGQTLLQNAKLVARRRSIIAEIADELSEFKPDLLITDFEAFTPRAAGQIGVPVLSFNHQQIVTRTRYELPARYKPHAFLTELTIRLLAPRNAVHTLLTSFYFPELKDPANTTIVRPIIRPAVSRLVPRDDGHVLVYFNQTSGSEFVIEALSQTDARFVVYNFDRPEGRDYPNIVFKDTSVDEFLDDLAGCSAVISTAGFTLTSEALFLGKPIMVAPNNGIFEQTLNALFLERDRLGAVVCGRRLTAEDVKDFLGQRQEYARRLQNRNGSGNEDALRCIERVLRLVGATTFPAVKPQKRSLVAGSLHPVGNG